MDFCLAEALVSKVKEEETYDLWHKRLGHLSLGGMKKLSQGLVDGVKLTTPAEQPVCGACAAGKQHRIPYPRSTSSSKEKLELVHSDVCGAMRVASLGGKRYFVTFIDDFTRMTFLYFIKVKSEVFEKFREFAAYAERATGRKIKALRTDNGTEYLSRAFQAHLKEQGIRHQTSVPFCPSQNGVSERANRTLVEKARTMLQHAGLDQRFWAEAVHTACRLKNVSPTSSLQDITPQEAWSEKKPDLRFLRVFGCTAYGHIPKENRTKFDPKSRKYIHLRWLQR